MKDFGKILKEASQFRELQKELPVLIKLANVPAKEVVKRTGISDTHYHNLLAGKKTVTAKNMLAMLRGIIEVQNYERLKIQINGKRESEY